MAIIENCSGQQREIRGEFFPKTKEEVIQIVLRANSEGFKIHPVSVGRNWGYGTRTPFDHDAYILNLSEMNQILGFDSDLRTVRIQPGVTQKQLADFLEKGGHDFLVPTTGAGENAGLLGNSLERGYGLTPWVDHFQSLTSLEAVLPDGSIYRSPMVEQGCPDVAAVYKWGLGPYFDGLFSQGNFGVITEATLCLQPRPERVSMILAGVNGRSEFLRAVQEIKDLMSSSGNIIGGVNYLNSLRTASMMRACPVEVFEAGRALTNHEVKSIEEELGLNEWNIVMSIYGSKALARTVEKSIKKKLSFVSRRPLILSNQSIRLAARLFKVFPFLRRTKLFRQFEKAKQAHGLFNGKPSNMAHTLTSWRTPADRVPHNFEIDASQAGLMWYAPVVPLTLSYFAKTEDIITRVCREHGFDPLITFTSNCDRYAIVTLALCFSRKTFEEVNRAQRCYEKLCVEGRRIGIFPYRSGTLSLPLMTETSTNRMQERMHKLLDPAGILDPSRHTAGPKLNDLQKDTLAESASPVR